MSKPPESTRFADRLLQQDTGLNGTQYKEYRMNLEMTLKSAEYREKMVSWIVVGSLVISIAGMFVGGSRAFGSFDPWDKDVTALSATLRNVYVLATIMFWISLASYFSRFRPKVKEIKDQIRDANIQMLHEEILDLKKQLAQTSRRDTSE